MTTGSLGSPVILFDPSLQARCPTGQCDCACDCACVPPSQSGIPDAALGAGGSLVKPGDSIYTAPLDGEHTLAFNTAAARGPAVLNRAALKVWNAFSTPSSLARARERLDPWPADTVERASRSLLAAGLLRPAACPPPQPASRPQLLAAWLHVTDRCPLRCAYCYLPHEPMDMPIAVGRAAIDAAFRSALAHGYGRIKLKYAGGEPLLRLPAILELHRYARRLAARHSLALDGVVLSNGVLLTGDRVRVLRDVGLRLMISLDGLGEAHDAQRPFADGRGSFTAVARGIDLAQKHNLVPDISVTVSGRNAADLPELVDWLLRRDLPFSINFYRQNHCAAPRDDLQLETEAVIAGVLEAYRVIERNPPPYSLLTALADRTNAAHPHLHTCSAGHSYLVFTPTGDVAKCQMDMGNPVADCWTPDPVAEIRHSAIGMENPSVEKKEECYNCIWRYQCSGGCPIEARIAGGSYSARSPHCAIYRRLIPEVLKLEGKRLLREQQSRADLKLVDQLPITFANVRDSTHLS